jgi:hypothetical protein
MGSSGNDNADAESRLACGTSTESRPPRIDLGAYCAEAVEALTTSEACGADAAVTAAVRTYLGAVGDKLELRVSTDLPEFEAVPTELTVELDLTGNELDRLEFEATRQGASVGRLVEQAVIAAYADLDRRRS